MDLRAACGGNERDARNTVETGRCKGFQRCVRQNVPGGPSPCTDVETRLSRVGLLKPERQSADTMTQEETCTQSLDTMACDTPIG